MVADDGWVKPPPHDTQMKTVPFRLDLRGVRLRGPCFGLTEKLPGDYLHSPAKRDHKQWEVA